MLKSVFSILLALTIALAGGAASVAWVLSSGVKSGVVTIGPWTSFPHAGTAHADAYAQAEVAIAGRLSLGRGEGLTFEANRDSEGNPIEARCAYDISGVMPPGRFWTLRTEAQGDSKPGAALHSREVLRSEDNSVQVIAAQRPHPGNWLPVKAGAQRIRVVLTVYDTSVTAGPENSPDALPSIKRTNCDA